MPPGFAAIGRFEEPQCRARENGVGMARVLGDDMRAAMGSWDALDLDPSLASGLAQINTAAGAGEDHLRVVRIHADGKDIRIVNQSGGDGLPIRAAIQGLPGQMRRPGVNGA